MGHRINVEVGISYRSSIADARKTLLESCKGDTRIATNPAPEVVVTELAASSVNLKLRYGLIRTRITTSHGAQSC